MGILMAFTAGAWSALEFHMNQLQFHVRWLVALGTRDRPVSAEQRKMCVSMIKLRQILPRLGGVTRFAARRLSRSICLGHPFGELSLMDILVASAACQMAEMELRRLRSIARLVAFIARYCHVAAGERKAGVLMLCQGVIRSLPC